MTTVNGTPTALALPLVAGGWPPFLTVPQACAVLGLERTAVRRMVHAGQLTNLSGKAGRSHMQLEPSQVHRLAAELQVKRDRIAARTQAVEQRRRLKAEREHPALLDGREDRVVTLLTEIRDLLLEQATRPRGDMATTGPGASRP